MNEEKVTYILTLQSGHFYVGSSCEFQKRLNRHLHELKRGIHHCLPFQQEWDKNPGLVGICTIPQPTVGEIRQLEQAIIEKFSSTCLLLNVGLGSVGGDNLSRNPRREDIIEKMTASIRQSVSKLSAEEKKARFGLPGELNPMFGKTHSDEARQKISLAQMGHHRGLGRKLSPEHIAKMSDRAKLRTGSKNPFFGKTHSDDTRKKLSESNKGRLPPNTRKVRIGDQVFESVTAAARSIGAGPALVLYRIKSKNPRFDSYAFV